MAASTVRTDDEQQLRDIQQQLARAWVQRDRDFIERVLAPEWKVTQANGSVLARTDVLRSAFDEATLVVESSTIDDVSVVLSGETAVVRGRTIATGLVDGKRVSARLRFTDTFVKRHGAWQAIASHASALAE
jgi:ketosteroid isomerase-like protein